jgi:hypothetical protein
MSGSMSDDLLDTIPGRLDQGHHRLVHTRPVRDVGHARHRDRSAGLPEIDDAAGVARRDQPFSSAKIGSKYSAKRLGFSANGKCPMPCIAWNRTPGIFAAVASDNSTVQE